MKAGFERIGFGLKNHILGFLFHLLPIQRKKVVACSFDGVAYGGNPKYILEVLNQKELGYRSYWIVKSKKEQKGLPRNIRPILKYSLRYYYHMATANVWIFDSRNPFPYKNKKTIYIQTWHGSIGLKKIEGDAQAALPAAYLKLAKHDSAMADVFLSNCRTLTTLYQTSFWYCGEILEVGLPRNDSLFVNRDDQCSEIKSKLNLPVNAKIVLYAPTFRADKTLDAYDIDFQELILVMEAKYQMRCIILVRLHPALHEQATTAFSWNEQFINATSFPDVQELYTISDIVLTDYSSVMFDFMYTGKPCLLYASDIVTYQKDRDFFIPLESLPFPLTTSNQSLFKEIQAFELESYQKEVAGFLLKHGFVDDGHASENVVAWLQSKILHS